MKPALPAVVVTRPIICKPAAKKRTSPVNRIIGRCVWKKYSRTLQQTQIMKIMNNTVLRNDPKNGKSHTPEHGDQQQCEVGFKTFRKTNH